MARKRTAKRSDRKANSANGANLGFEATLWAANHEKQNVPSISRSSSFAHLMTHRPVATPKPSEVR